MEHWNVQRFLQPFFDFKAARRADVLQIDASKARGEPGDGLDDFFCILGVQADGNRVHAGKFLEQDSLSLHDRHGGVRADIAKAQNCRTIGNHSDGVRLHRVGIGGFFVLCDYLTGFCHARRIGQSKVFPGFYRNLGNGFQLSVQFFVKRKRFFVSSHIVLCILRGF